MKLFHRTVPANAEKILAEGFRDSSGGFLTAQEWSGVWLSDRPLDSNEGAKGDVLLSIEIPEQTIADYEWEEEGKPYREFLAPAALINSFGKARIVGDESV